MVVVIGSTSRNRPIVIRMMAKIGWPIMRRNTSDSKAAPMAATHTMANSALLMKPGQVAPPPNQSHVVWAW